jgi:hypothetical protein
MLRIQKRVLGEEHPDTLTSMGGLAQIYTSQGKYAQAESLLRKVLAIQQGAKPDSWARYLVQNLLGASLAGQKKYAQAEPLLVSGYIGLKQHQATIPSARRHVLCEGGERASSSRRGGRIRRCRRNGAQNSATVTPLRLMPSKTSAEHTSHWRVATSAPRRRRHHRQTQAQNYECEETMGDPHESVTASLPLRAGDCHSHRPKTRAPSGGVRKPGIHNVREWATAVNCA